MSIPQIKRLEVEHERGRPRYLYTLNISLIFSGVVAGIIIWKVPPSEYTTLILLAAIGYFVCVSVALLLFRFTKPKGFEDDRRRFRRGFMWGFLIGLLVIITLASQLMFDIV